MKLPKCNQTVNATSHISLLKDFFVHVRRGLAVVGGYILGIKLLIHCNFLTAGKKFFDAFSFSKKNKSFRYILEMVRKTAPYFPINITEIPPEQRNNVM